jgi:nitrogen regulatory protein PII 2
MKEIMAVIRQDKMNATKAALAEAGICSLTAQKVLGRGKGNVDYQILEGAEEGNESALSQLGNGPRMIPKRMLTLVVPDDKKENVIQVLLKVNKAGKPGDGKIFVLPLENAYRVRTGESSDAALDEA